MLKVDVFFYRSKVLTIWIRVIISVHLTFIITVSYSGLDFNRDRDDLRFPGFSWVSTVMICAGVLNIQLCMNGLLASNCQFACGRLVIGVFAIILALTELIWKQWVLFCRTSLSFSLRAIITLNFLFKKLVQETFQGTILVQVLHRCIHVGLASQMPNSKIVAPKICNCAFMKKLLHAVNL